MDRIGSDGLFLFIVLGVDLIFIAIRSSLLNARPAILASLQEKKPRAVERTLRLLEKHHLRASLRVGVVLTHFLLAGAVGLLVLDCIGKAVMSLVLVAGIAIFLALFILIAEFAVEGLVLRNVENWSLRLAPFGEFIEWVFRPAAWLLMRLLGSRDRLKQIQDPVIEDELRNWVKEGDVQGSLEHDERKMIYSIFQLGDTLCREIMVPRIDMTALDVTTSFEEAVRVVCALGHSRVPVYEETIDNVIGLLHVKDLLRLQTQHQTQPAVPFPIRSLLRPVYFVPEAKNVSDLMREMQAKAVHMAIVVDEYGGVAGLVTLEDIVEEIVGEIRDEYDHGEELPYQKTPDGEFIFQGRIDVADVNELLDTHLTREIADTLGGFIFSSVGRVPTEGEQVAVEDWVLTVEQVERRRILKVKAARVKQSSEDTSGQSENTKEEEDGTE